ncbi:MAG: hypothetical protein LBQ79_07565 [Deltaproteobacteria bacterium]|jgi:hypothetical protein|nr:hypothetical protein [Deltaproteobacteria bacterium]
MPEHDTALAGSQNDTSTGPPPSMPDSGAPPPNLPDRVTRLEVQMEGVNKQLDQVATKSDIAILTRYINALEVSLKSDINAVEVSLKSDIKALNGKIENLEVNLDGKIVNLDGKIENLKVNLDGKIVNLDGKIVNLEKRFDDMRSQLQLNNGIGMGLLAVFITFGVFVLTKIF